MPAGRNGEPRFVVAVPARLESSRLPGKVLADIGGKPMLRRVLEAAAEGTRVSGVLLCTDAEELRALATDWGFPVLMTPASCSSGSERIASALDRIEGDVIINVQADQPFLRGSTLDRICTAWGEASQSPEVLTPIYRLDPKLASDPSRVKVVIRRDGRALYFSRAALPHRGGGAEQESPDAVTWAHLGIYAYRRSVLARWSSFGASELERAERLEQLRLLEYGVEIHTVEVGGDPRELLSVDTPTDLERARALTTEGAG